MLRAVLFDLDHTLIDWEVAESWDTYQARRLDEVYHYVNKQIHPLDDVSPEEFFGIYLREIEQAWQDSRTTFVAPDVRVYLPAVLTACGVPADRIDLDALINAYDWQPPAGIRVYPDVPDVLPELAAHGLILGIITNASHPMVLRDRELAAIGLLDHFPACRIAAADAGYVKPHRQIFAHALDLLQLEPDEAIYVGDNPEADILGAQGAGMRAVLRLSGHYADPADDVTPDGSIETLYDLPPLLDEWYPGWRANGHKP